MSLTVKVKGTLSVELDFYSLRKQNHCAINAKLYAADTSKQVRVQ